MRLGFFAGLFLLPCAAWAHGTIDTHIAPLLAGLIDPALNPAHLLAVVSIGMFAGLSGGSARWAYPISLLGATMLGGFVGYIEPFAEPIVVLLVLFLSMAVFSLLSGSPLVGIGSVIALWSAVHGYLHGLELTAFGGPLFGVGLLLAIGVLQGTGLLIGIALGPPRPVVIGTMAALTCLLGLLVLVG